MLKWQVFIAALACQPALAHAQPAPAGQPVQPVPSSLITGPAIPALTPVSVRILAPLGSKSSTTGEFFPIELAAAIVVDGREVTPAGARGEGEVVHAKPAGGGGAAGELVLAARYVMLGERRLRLRSLRLSLAGKDAIGKVGAFGAAAAVSPVPLGLLGFAIAGRNVEIPSGTIAAAKTAEAFPLEPAAADPARPTPAVAVPGARPIAP